MSSRLCSQIRKIMQILTEGRNDLEQLRSWLEREALKIDHVTARAALGVRERHWERHRELSGSGRGRASGGRGLGGAALRGGGAAKLGRWRGVFGAGLSVKKALSAGLKGRVGGVAGAGPGGGGASSLGLKDWSLAGTSHRCPPFSVMSLTPLRPPAAELREPAGPPPPPDPDSRAPSSKRPRLGEPGGACEAGWRLPLVPRLSEVEKEWALSPRPFRALLLSPDAIFASSGGGKQTGRGGCQNSPCETNAGLQCPPSPSVHSGSRASRRFSEAGLCDGAAVRVPRGDGSRAEGAPLRPHTSLRRVQGLATGAGKGYVVPGGGNRQDDSGDRKLTGNLPRGLPFDEEPKPTSHEAEDGRQAGSAAQPNKKERNMAAASTLQTPRSQSQPGTSIARPGGFCREGGAGPLDLGSTLSPSKQRAKKRGDRNEAYATGFTNIDWPPNRPTVKRRKLLGDTEMVDAEALFPERGDGGEHRVCVKGEHAISFRCDQHRGVQSAARDPGAHVTLTLHSAARAEAGASLDWHIAARLGKRQRESDSIRHMLRKNRENSWVMHSYQTKCESMTKTGEKWNLLQSSDTALLSQEDCYDIKAMNTHEEPPQLLMIGTLGSQKAVINFFWFRGKGESDNRLQLPLQYYTSQKDCDLSNSLVNFITERFYLHKSISAKEADNSMLAWHEILKCLKQTDVHNLIIRNISVNRRNNILSIYLQTGVSKSLHIILKTNIAPLLNNFDSLTGTENDSKLEEGCIFKWIMCLNYPRNIMVENQIVYLGRTLTVSIPLADSMKPMLEEKKLFKTEQVFEEFKKKNIDFFSMTTKNIILVDFDDRDEISYKSKTCPEQGMNVKNWAQCGTNSVKIHVNSPPQFIQNNYKHINENFYEINMFNENIATERQQEHNKISSFNFTCIAEDIFNVSQQAIPASHCTKRTEQTNPMIVTQVQNFGSLLKSEIEAKRHDLILMEEENVIAQSLTYCHQVHKDIKIEKEEKNSFYSMDGIFSVQPVSLMSRKVNVEEAKYVNQLNLADKKEYESILQESELANLKHFYPKNDSVECVKHQFEADLSVQNNECFQDLTAKCLPTEVMTIAKDFEMKSEFDLVLEELHMFHKISKENEILSTVETNNGQENYFRENNAVEAVKTKIKKDLKIGTVNKICESSLLCDAKAGPNMHKRHQSLFNWEIVPRNREQEVPNAHPCLRTSEEEVLYSTSEEDCEKPSPKRPAFSSDEFKEEKINYIVKGGSNFSHGISRVLPLKTCSRPIRVGLSRKAKLKQLHPYL